MTSRCSLVCAVCPRTHLAGWRDGHLSEAAWRRLEPDLGLASDVHLQGWGEPLLDPGLRARVRAVHRAGCSVGFTTNGIALEAAREWIVTEQVDRVAVSVATGGGRDAGPGGRAAAREAFQGIAALARERRRGRPRLLVGVLLTRDPAGLADLVLEAGRAGVDEVYVTHVDCTPTPALLARTAFAGGALRPGLAEALREAQRAARLARVRFRTPALHADDLLVCALDPRRFAFVSWDGRVGPCVNLLLPLDGLIPRCTAAGTSHVAPATWGSLPQHSLAEILAGEARRGFVAPFGRRIEAERRFLDAVGTGWGSEALADLERADFVRVGALDDAPFPAACRGCHKAQGW